jgi:hypothetical protein
MRTQFLPAAAALLAAGALAAAPPGGPGEGVKPVEVTSLGQVNTPADEDDPHVLGNVLYYASNAKGKFDLMVAARANALTGWPRGRVVDGVQTEVDDRSPFVVSERSGFQYLFFATMKDKETNNFDLYVAQRFDTRKPFSEPTPVHAADSEADELHPWLTADGKQLYFSRKTKDGWRVFVTAREGATGPGGFGEPKEVKGLPPGFHHATLMPDGKTMYLQGPLEKGRWGLFRTTRAGEGWSEPAPLVRLNNPDGPTGDRSPSLSRDGNTLYFASDRPGGKGGRDLYSVPTPWLAEKK